jgi:hypothetical protein
MSYLSAAASGLRLFTLFNQRIAQSPARQSSEYQRTNEIGTATEISAGFKDAGRSTIFDRDGNLSSPARREIIVVPDPSTDRHLSMAITEFKAIDDRRNAPEIRARQLSRFVAEKLSISDPTDNENIMDSVCGGSARGHEVSLGTLISLKTGVCRHRSLLYKIIADQVDLPCRLVRGSYAGRDFSGNHAWNEIIGSNGNTFIVDSSLNRFIHSSAEEAQGYRGIDGNPRFQQGDTPHISDIIGNLKPTAILKGNKLGVELNLRNLTEEQQTMVDIYFSTHGLKGFITNSSAQNGDVVMRFFDKDAHNRIDTILDKYRDFDGTQSPRY